MTTVTYTKEDVVGYDCRHVFYCPHPNGVDDMHLVKEYVHLKEGPPVINMRLLKNFQQPFWVTREGYRNHREKKEWEALDKLQEYKSNRAGQLNAISRAVSGKPLGKRGQLRELAKTPYLYGCDILSTCLIKHEYQTRWPDLIAPSASVAVFDIETDVNTGTNDVIICTLSFKNRVFTAISERFLTPGRNEEIIRKLADTHIGELIKKRGIQLELAWFKDGADCVEACIRKGHEYKPDFIEIWNIDFDIPKCIEVLKNAGKDLADIFSDPIVPKAYQYFKYIQGPKQKVIQDGTKRPLHPADQWHRVECPASFYFLDGMCVYKRLRIAKGMEPGYGLDAVLARNGLMGKLSLPEVDHLNGLAWHKTMQRDHPCFYVVYNIYDCVGVELLDEKIGDISSRFPVLCGVTDYSNFTKNPRRICDSLHFFLRDKYGLIIATTGDDGKTNTDSEELVGMRGWIATLDATLVVDNGVPVFSDLKTIRSMIRRYLADLDIEGTYPTEEVVMNLSKETTAIEMIRIEGLSEKAQRRIGINMTGGVANAIELCSEIYDLPSPEEWVDMWDAEQEAKKERI